MNKLCFILFLLLFSVTVFAEDEIDSFVQSEMQKEKIPGLALLMVKDGQIVKEKGYGYASLEHMVPVTPETVFQSGSMGKQFTATAVMLLVEDGKIQLDDPVGEYIEGAPDTWKNIKIRNLLTHTSGLGDYPEDFNYRQDRTEDQLLEMLKKQPLSFQPGEKWEYSNLGYMLLGIVIHKVSGQFYGDLLQERVSNLLE
jgi:CubicO group peptidase (beta-lactamase class C family)